MPRAILSCWDYVRGFSHGDDQRADMRALVPHVVLFRLGESTL